MRELSETGAKKPKQIEENAEAGERETGKREPGQGKITNDIRSI